MVNFLDDPHFIRLWALVAAICAPWAFIAFTLVYTVGRDRLEQMLIPLLQRAEEVMSIIVDTPTDEHIQTDAEARSRDTVESDDERDPNDAPPILPSPLTDQSELILNTLRDVRETSRAVAGIQNMINEWVHTRALPAPPTMNHPSDRIRFLIRGPNRLPYVIPVFPEHDEHGRLIAWCNICRNHVVDAHHPIHTIEEREAFRDTLPWDEFNPAGFMSHDHAFCMLCRRIVNVVIHQVHNLTGVDPLHSEEIVEAPVNIRIAIRTAFESLYGHPPQYQADDDDSEIAVTANEYDADIEGEPTQ